MNQFCECEKDGFCNRYQREMTGRFREICRSENVDLGTAAAFRDQWRREANSVPQKVYGDRTPLLLKTHQAPGDAVAMTAAIYSLHQQHPKRYLTIVETYWPEVFYNNPNVTAHIEPNALDLEGVTPIQMHYPAIHQSNDRAIHFMQGWCEFLSQTLCVDVPLLTNRPHLYFNTPEPKQEDFWVICAGGKRDFTTKLWGAERYQEVVDRLKGAIRFVQVGGSSVPTKLNDDSQRDEQPRLHGVINLVNKTTLRQLFDLVRRARGVICGVSLLMHVAAALEKPAIVIAGGREPVAWNAYPLQHYLHTVGMLPCTDARNRQNVGCWRYRTVPLGDHATLDANPCLRPIGDVPECLTLINPADVVSLARRIHSQR